MSRSAVQAASGYPESGQEGHFYLGGGGIASLAAAAFLIRDGDVLGRNITILEEADRLGGSLDGAGTPADGYVLRGGRMLESKYLCTYDLFSSVPTLDESRTVTQEIFAWNETMKTSSKARLFRDGHRIDAPEFGLSEGHILTLERLAIEPEAMLGRTSIADQFDPSFLLSRAGDRSELGRRRPRLYGATRKDVPARRGWRMSSLARPHTARGTLWGAESPLR